MRNFLIFGGTFDPPHWGHIKILQTIQKEFAFDKVLIIPCKEPTDKPNARVHAKHRIKMLQKILPLIPMASIDTREILRKSPSYTIETIKSIKQETSDNIILCIGMDAFLNFEKWKQYKEILANCKILVVARHNYTGDLLQKNIVQDKDEFLSANNGSIFIFNAGHYDVSSSKIRDLIHHNDNIEDLMPLDIIEYIKAYNLYTT